MQPRNAQCRKLLYKVQHLTTRRPYPFRVGALVKRVKNHINRNVSRGLEHIFEAFCECADTRLPRTILVSRVEVEERTVKGLRLIAELDDERGE